MNNIDVLIAIVPVTAGWMFVIAFGQKIQDWYENKKTQKQNIGGVR